MIEGTSTIIPGQYLYPALAWRCPSPGENPENLHGHHHLHDEELEGRRTALSVPLLPSTQGFAWQRRQGFVDTSTSCSTSCVSRTTVRTNILQMFVRLPGVLLCVQCGRHFSGQR